MASIIKIVTSQITALALLICMSGTVLAQADLGFGDAENIATGAGISTQDARALIVSAIRVGLTFVGIIAVAIIIYGGFLFITSAGDEDKAGRAKRLILYAVIGLLMIGLAAVITNLVIDTFQGGS